MKNNYLSRKQRCNTETTGKRCRREIHLACGTNGIKQAVVGTNRIQRYTLTKTPKQKESPHLKIQVGEAKAFPKPRVCSQAKQVIVDSRDKMATAGKLDWSWGWGWGAEVGVLAGLS